MLSISRSSRLLWLSKKPFQCHELSTVAPRPVISRRAWQAHFEKLPKKPKVVRAKPDEKPWPRNVQIGAGVAACFFVPYTAIWIITSNPSLRETLGPYLPLEKFRKHFGELEWDGQSFADEEEEEAPPSLYKYPMEDSFRDRQQQAIVEDTDSLNIATKVFVLGDMERQEVRKISGSQPADPRRLAHLVGAEGDSKVAVEFVDPDIETTISNDANLFEENSKGESSASGLLKRIYGFSTWHYTPAPDQMEEAQKKASDIEIEKLRMEYTIQQLESDLKHPMCTRDHDEMRAELKQTKSNLSRLKWKLRLGL